MPTEASVRALKILRDGSQFQWYVIPLLALVLYLYAVEIERKNWNLVFAGLALWGMDWFNEIWNGLVFHFTQYAPVWGAPARTAYLILIGLNIEICFMFAVAGLIVAKVLPADKTRPIFGMPNRLFIAVTASVFCVVVELLLNAVDALTWDYRWWNARVLKASFIVHAVVLMALWVALVRPSIADSAGLGNALKREEGWQQLGAEVSAVSRRTSYDAIVADNRSIAAELLYYARPYGAPMRVWARDLSIRDHFEMTMRLAAGTRRVLLVLEPASAGRVLATFDSAVRVKIIATAIGGHHQRVTALYDARHYRGPQFPS